MDILNETDLNTYLSSNDDYESKIRFLKNQKEYIESANIYLNKSLEDLSNGTYLKSMIDRRNKMISDSDKDLFKGTFLGGLGVGSVSYEISNLININSNNIPLSLKELLIECLISFTSIALLFYSADKFKNCIDYSKDIKSYNKYINEYKRKLKKEDNK